MGSATVKWIQGKQFVGIDSTCHSVVLSTADEGVGMKPSELLLIAVASCSAVDIVDILTKKRMRLLSWRSTPAANRTRIRRGPIARSTSITAWRART